MTVLGVLTVLGCVLAGLVLLFAIVVAIAGLLFERSVRAEARELLQVGNRGASGVVTEEDIAGLPEPVQRWLRRSGVVGRERLRTVKLRQKGAFQPGPGKPSMPYVAVQYYSADPPAFIWHARVKQAGLPIVEVKDSLRDGRGRILVKMAGLMTLDDLSGIELDQGVALRFLNEIMFFPSAALYPYITWQPFDADAAEATITLGDTIASAIFIFNKLGDLVDMTAVRYRRVDSGFSLDRWSTPITSYGEFEGVRVPTAGSAVWHLESGDLPYVNLKVTHVDYNATHPY